MHKLDNLLQADFSVSSSGDTYCAVPTKELALAVTQIIDKKDHTMHQCRPHKETFKDEDLVYCLMITVLLSQNL